MTISELKTARRELGFNEAEMALRLKTPYRTYLKWENGQRRIPGLLEAAVELLLEKDRRFMAAITGRK